MTVIPEAQSGFINRANYPRKDKCDNFSVLIVRLFKLPHTTKKYKKSSTQTESNRLGLIVVIAIIAIIAAAGGWYVYSSYIATTTTTTNADQIIYARIYTTVGVMNIELFQSKAPLTVANFVHLAESGFYNNLVWHRIVSNFVIQTGDPLTRNAGGNRSLWGTGGSNTTVPLEVSSLENNYGYIAMAHTSVSTNATSQFYINLHNNTNLNGQYTVFGYVTSGMSVALAISNATVYQSQSSPYYDQPVNPAAYEMINVTILNSTSSTST